MINFFFGVLIKYRLILDDDVNLSMVESYMIFIDSGLGSIYSVVLSNIIVFSFVIVCLNEEIEKKELCNKS